MPNINVVDMAGNQVGQLTLSDKVFGPFGQRLTAYMISNKIADSAVPMSLLSDHPSVIFNYFRGGFGVCDVEMH